MDPILALLLVPLSLVTAVSAAGTKTPRTPQPPPPDVPSDPTPLAPAVHARRLALHLHRAPPREARATATAALEHRDGWIRLAAARFLQRGDVLATLVASSWLEEDLRAAALGALDATGDRPAALAGVSEGLRAAARPVRIAAAQLAERLRDLGTLPALCTALQALVMRWPDADDGVLRETVALARAFARLHGAPVEYALLRLVEAPARDARAVALAGLARVGTRRALPALARAAEVSDATLREAARGALAATRFRTGDARGGALSLARTAPGGALSLYRHGPECS